VTKRLISQQEAAQYVGISTTGIWRAVKRGDLQLVKIGGRALIEISDLDRLISKSKQVA
jgi:excisionase family DNA binding protein